MINKKTFSIVLLVLIAPLISLIQFPVFERFIDSYSRYLLFFLAFIFGYQEFRESNAKVIQNFTVALGLLESIFVIVNYRRFHNFGGWLFGNPHYSDILIGPGLIYLSAIFVEAKSLRIRLAVSVGFLIFGIGAFLLASRTLYVGIFIAFLWLLIRGSQMKSILIGFILLLIITFPGGEYLGRLLIWKTSLLAIFHHPLIGYGLGNYELVYRLYQLPTSQILRYDKTTIFAHNDYLQLLVNLGLVGAIPLCLFFRDVFWGKKDDLDSKYLKASLIYFGVTSLFNFNFYLPFGIILMAVSLGAYSGVNQADKTAQGQRKFPALFFSVPTLFFFLFYQCLGLSIHFEKADNDSKARVFGFFRADYWYEAARKKINTAPSNYLQATIALEKSLHWDRFDSFTWNRLATVCVLQNVYSNSVVQHNFEKAISLHPMHAPFWIDKAQFEYKNGYVASALNDLNRAAELEPNAPLVYFCRGILYKEVRKWSEAKRDFVMALETYNSYKNQVPQSGYSDYLFDINPGLVGELLARLEKAK